MDKKNLLRNSLYAASLGIGLGLFTTGLNLGNHKSNNIIHYESLVAKIENHTPNYRIRSLEDYYDHVHEDSLLLRLLVEKDKFEKDNNIHKEIEELKNRKDLSEICYIFGFMLMFYPIMKISDKKDK